MVEKKLQTKRKIVDATLRLAEKFGWETICFADISNESSVSLSEIYRIFPNKIMILEEFEKITNQELLEKFSGEELNPDTHDMLIDIIVERLEIMNRSGKAIKSAYKQILFSPVTVAKEIPLLSETVRWFFEIARIDNSGIHGNLKIIGLSAIYIKTLCKWVRQDDLNNESNIESLMASLDKDLSRAEKLADMIGMQ